MATEVAEVLADVADELVGAAPGVGGRHAAIRSPAPVPTPIRTNARLLKAPSPCCIALPYMSVHFSATTVLRLTLTIRQLGFGRSSADVRSRPLAARAFRAQCPGHIRWSAWPLTWIVITPGDDYWKLCDWTLPRRASTLDGNAPRNITQRVPWPGGDSPRRLPARIAWPPTTRVLIPPGTTCQDGGWPRGVRRGLAEQSPYARHDRAGRGHRCSTRAHLQCAGFGYSVSDSSAKPPRVVPRHAMAHRVGCAGARAAHGDDAEANYNHQGLEG